MAVIEKTYIAPKTVEKFMLSDAFFRVIMGPLGSGKSVGCVMEIVRRCLTQKVGVDGFRRSRWAVIRNTNQQLKDTTLKTWLDWIPDGVAGRWAKSDMTYYLEFEDVRAEILFRSLESPDDVRKVLSLELTGVWLNEAREIKRELVEGLQGRLKRYPSKAMGGSNYWCMIADTNPPEEETYWYNIIEHLPTNEEQPDTVVPCDSFKQGDGREPDADNKENLEDNYYEDLAKGKSEEWVDVYIGGNYAKSQAGKPVYLRKFKTDVHVVDCIPIDPDMPVIIGMDFGLTPAAVFKQVTQDGRVMTLHSIAEFDMGIKRFISLRLKPVVNTRFATNPIVIVGDPSGVRRSDTDEGTCFKELRAAGFRAIPAPTNDPTVRIEATENLLMEYPDGVPRYQVDKKHNKFYIEALRSKYRFRRKGQGGDEFHTSPEKNDWSHVAEAGQYADLFITSGRYRHEDYVLIEDGVFTETYSPADSTMGY